MHTNSKLLFDKYARQCFQPQMRVLEIGPDEFPSTYQQMVNDTSISWHTLDIRKNPSLTYLAQSEYDFPVESGSYDLVLSGQVIEHVRQIWTWMPELVRVCRTGGLVITVNPAQLRDGLR